MMISDRIARGIGFVTVLAAVVVTTVLALGTGQSFNMFLESGYEQELYGATDLGADPTIGDRTYRARRSRVRHRMVTCGRPSASSASTARVSTGSTARRTAPCFTARPRCIPRPTVDTMGGCGLVNHPDGAAHVLEFGGGRLSARRVIRGGHGHVPRDGRQTRERARHCRGSAAGSSRHVCRARRVIRRCRGSWTSWDCPMRSDVQDLRPGSLDRRGHGLRGTDAGAVHRRHLLRSDRHVPVPRHARSVRRGPLR